MNADDDAPTAPPVIASLPGSLALRWASHMIMLDKAPARGERPPVIDAGAMLMIPLCETDLAGRRDYLDIFQLWESAERAGRYRLVNCACGIAYDADVDGGMRVTHPDPATVVWDIGVQGMRGLFPRPPPWGDAPGIVRLIFARADYERDIRAFVRAMQARIAQPLRWDDIGHLEIGCIEASRAEYPHLDALPIINWLPGWGDDNLEELRAMDPDAPFVLGPPLAQDESCWPPLS